LGNGDWGLGIGESGFGLGIIVLRFKETGVSVRRFEFRDWESGVGGWGLGFRV